ncbi:hypothetical protein [Rhodopila sp.]|uniref:hypothetical protein n=1 Tax=Rhodopila sp. TaxID=2480087 RepID=UPI003D0C8B31
MRGPQSVVEITGSTGFPTDPAPRLSAAPAPPVRRFQSAKAAMLNFQVDTAGLTRMERALTLFADKQLRYATARALNDCTQAASVAVNKAMPEVFDRPIPFTERAAIAPRDLAATRDHLVSTVTLRPIQAAYLLAEEQGGTRTPGQNTRKPGTALVLPGKGTPLDAYGNIPNSTLKNFRAQAKADQRARRKRLSASRRAAKVEQAAPPKVDETNTIVFLAAQTPGNKAAIGGYFRRLSNHHLTRLTAFEPETHYHARLGYHARVQATFAHTWLPALLRRLYEALATAH